MSTEGVDYSTHHPDPAGLYAVGKRFAIRYGGPGSSPKHLTLDEAHALADAGLSIVANAEGVADGLLGGALAGANWARSAEAHFRDCGMPSDRPVYLSADFDVTAGQWPHVAAALRGAAGVLGPGRVGVYGGYDAIAWAARDKVARWFWQTKAWSEGRWHPIAHIRQYRNKVSLVGGTVDLDLAMVADYGQWTPGAGPGDDGGGTMTQPEDVAKVDIAPGAAEHTWGGADWTTFLRVANIYADQLPRVQADLDRVEAALSKLDDQVPDDLGEIVGTIRTAVDELMARPLVDAVAVADAIAAHPEVVDTLADRVAARLAEIHGEIILSGALTAKIRPPA